MHPSELPAEVRRFILTSVPSVPYLEAVLLLRSDESRSWAAGELARRLYVPERKGAELVQQLRGAAVAADDPAAAGAVRYAPAAELRERIDRVAHAYASDLLAVTDLIHSRIDRRAQQFADAFRIRKD